ADTHRGDDCALRNFVFVRQQNATAQPIQSAAVGRVGAEVEFRIYNCALPLANISLTMGLERHSQRLEQLGSSDLVAAAKCYGDCKFAEGWQSDYAGQRHIT